MQDRMSALRERLAAANLDALVITHPSNRFYLSGYTGDDIPPNESAGHLIITPDKAILTASTTNSEQARQQATGFEVFDKIRGLAQADVAVLKELGAKRIGFEDDAILYADYQTLATELDGVELVPVGDMVDSLREVKTDEEIALLARAIEITDQAFEQVAATIREGDRERDIAARLERAMVDLGADGVAFPTIVASGPNAALPHHSPGDRQIAAGEPIVIDMGALYNGYCADLTRTVWVGEPDERLREIYPIVLEALTQTAQALRAGVTGKEADEIARKVIGDAGYGDAFVHGLGHGLGVRVHEGPSLGARNVEPLVAGNVLTIEPGIYLPEWSGVRIEDVVVIEEQGARVLTGAKKYEIA